MLFTASIHVLRKHYGDTYLQTREAMNGMLSINMKYHIEGSHWQQFTHDVIKAFNHPLFSGLRRASLFEKVSRLF